MFYEDIPLGEYGDKGIWRRFVGRVLERDLATDLARAAQHGRERTVAADIKLQSDKAEDEQALALKRQQEREAKRQELLQQPAWIAERERAYVTGGEKALSAINAQQDMKAKREIARAEDRQSIFNRPPSRERGRSIGR